MTQCFGAFDGRISSLLAVGLLQIDFSEKLIERNTGFVESCDKHFLAIGHFFVPIRIITAASAPACAIPAQGEGHNPVNIGQHDRHPNTCFCRLIGKF